MSSNVKIGTHDVSLIGKFQLKVNRDPKIFKITNINAFVPQGKTINDRMYFKTKSGLVESLLIDKIVFTLNPDVNPIDHHNVNALIQHDDVRIWGMSEEDHQELVRLGFKKSNPKFTIKNIDKFEDEKFDNDVNLVLVRARIYDKVKPIEKKKLIWLCSKFGISYATNVTEESRYINSLKKTLDGFVQQSEANANAFMKALENIKMTEMSYYISEFKSMGIISDMGGIYKVGERPVGSGNESLVSFFDMNPEVFKAHKNTVIKKYQETVLA